MEPHEPPVAPVIDHIPSLTMSPPPHLPTPIDVLVTFEDFLVRQVDAFSSVLLAAIATWIVLRCIRVLMAPFDGLRHPATSDLRKDSEPVSATARDRSWRCRFCGERGSLYGTGQQEASAALAHTAKCPRRHSAPPVRRCTECAAPIDPVDGLLDGLFEDEEPGPTGWEPGMPAWGTPPLLPLRNHAQAELFRQMISDALSRSKGGPV